MYTYIIPLLGSNTMGQGGNMRVKCPQSPIQCCNACSRSWHCRALGCSSGEGWTEPEASKEEGPGKPIVDGFCCAWADTSQALSWHTAIWAWHSLLLPYSGSYHWATQLQLSKLLLDVRYREMQMCLGSFHKISEQSSSSIQPSPSIAQLSLVFQLSHMQIQLHCHNHLSSPSSCIRSQEAEQQSAATRQCEQTAGIVQERREEARGKNRNELSNSTRTSPWDFAPVVWNLFLITSWWHLPLSQHEVRKLHLVLGLEYILISVSDFFVCQQLIGIFSWKEHPLPAPVAPQHVSFLQATHSEGQPGGSI